MADTQADHTVDSESRWAPKNNTKNPGESDRSNGHNSKPAWRGKKDGRTRGIKPRRVPRGPAQRDSADEDEGNKGDASRRNSTKHHRKSSRDPSVDSNQSASLQSETSEEEDDDDKEEEEEEEEEEEADEDPRKDEKHQKGKDENHQQNHEIAPDHEQAEDIEATTSKHHRRKSTDPERHKEPQLKSSQKRQPYVRQVELPKEKLSAADLEAKMASMALKNAQLMEQKKAADQDAAEYREIELKSQQAFEAQRDQQKEIDAVRQLAAKRKLKKSQGREWDIEKSEDDWNRSRPYTDSMTNPNPVKNSWYSGRGSGYRGRPGRGQHNSERGMGRGGKRGGRGGMGNRQDQRNEHVKPQSPDRSQPPHMGSHEQEQSNTEANTQGWNTEPKTADWNTEPNLESNTSWN